MAKMIDVICTHDSLYDKWHAWIICHLTDDAEATACVSHSNRNLIKQHTSEDYIVKLQTT